MVTALESVDKVIQNETALIHRAVPVSFSSAVRFKLCFTQNLECFSFCAWEVISLNVFSNGLLVQAKSRIDFFRSSMRKRGKTEHVKVSLIGEEMGGYT